jgi:hypothetical protein
MTYELCKEDGGTPGTPTDPCVWNNPNKGVIDNNGADWLEIKNPNPSAMIFWVKATITGFATFQYQEVDFEIRCVDQLVTTYAPTVPISYP